MLTEKHIERKVFGETEVVLKGQQNQRIQDDCESFAVVDGQGNKTSGAGRTFMYPVHALLHVLVLKLLRDQCPTDMHLWRHQLSSAQGMLTACRACRGGSTSGDKYEHDTCIGCFEQYQCPSSWFQKT